jgi:hypothetical protein
MSRTARAWVELMRRLGYPRYGVHGGDIGGGVSGMVADLAPENVTGVHVVTDPLTAAAVATFLPGLADRLDANDPVDKLVLDRMATFAADGSGYLAIQNSRPQTIGYGLVDSPLLQLAWIAEKFEAWTDLPIDRDQVLTTVSLYWFTRSGASAAHRRTPSTGRAVPPRGGRWRVARVCRPWPRRAVPRSTVACVRAAAPHAWGAGWGVGGVRGAPEVAL